MALKLMLRSSPVNNSLRSRKAWFFGRCKYRFSQGTGGMDVKSLRFRTPTYVGASACRRDMIPLAQVVTWEMRDGTEKA